MARRPRALIEGGIYHVTCRGNERRFIFWDDRDRKRFLKRLEESASTHQVRVYLYCLMPNHFHLLVETPLGNLNRFMGSLLTGYTVYFNRRHKRTGHLMQGRYGSQVVEGNEYLLKLSRYIHLNPVQVRDIKKLPMKDRLCHLQMYRWSSFREYAGKDNSSEWLSSGPVLAMMEKGDRDGAGRAYVRYVETGLAKTDEEFNCLMGERGIAIGSKGFIEDIKNLYLRVAMEERKQEDVSFRQIRTWKTLQETEDAVREIVGDRWEQFNLYKAGRIVRGFTAWALRQYVGLTQRDIAPHVGVKTGAAVSLMIRDALANQETQEWQKRIDLRFKG